MKARYSIGIFVFMMACAVGFAKSKREPAGLVLGYDKSCWNGNENLIADVQAVPLTCDDKSCASFEKVLNLKSKPKYAINFAELSKKTGLTTENTVIVVSVCADTNGNNRCDEKPIHQVMRLPGRHMKLIYPEGSMQINFVDVKGGVECSSL